MFWWLMKNVLLGPLLRLFFHPTAEGLENVPTEGGAILAGNHQSFLDDVLLPLVIPGRKVVFLGKAEYFEKWYLRWFFKGAGMIPIRRGGGSAAEAALDTAVEALRDGKLIGIFPEGTRSPDGKLYRGKTGVARMALEAGVPVIPIAMINTDVVQPTGKVIPRLGRVGVKVGAPLDFSRYAGMEGDRFVLRSVTDEIMYELMQLSGQEYVDTYATKAKADIAEARQAAEEALVADDRMLVGSGRKAS